MEFIIVMKRAVVFWLTGMSGAGKSTLANYLKIELEKMNNSVLMLDGDIVRSRYKKTMGFSREEVEKNNLNVASICEDERENYDVIVVPIISSIDQVRKAIRKSLGLGFYLIYVKSDLETLKSRDTKGLYKKADSGELDNLIGYSSGNPYDEPEDMDLLVDTTVKNSEEFSKKMITDFVMKRVVASVTKGVLL